MASSLVNFVVVGAQKCGTTGLCNLLSQCEDVCFCHEKEPHFFSKNLNWRENIQCYEKLFDAKPGQLLAEGSTSYSFLDEYPETMKNLYDYNPNLKLIYIIRDPVKRIESHYNHRLRLGRISHDVVKNLGSHPCFIERSEYFRQLQGMLDYFPAEQIKIVVFEDYIKNPEREFNQVIDFLGVTKKNTNRMDFSPANVSDASLKFNSSIIKFVLRLLSNTPYTYKFSKWLPIKTYFSEDINRLIWRILEPDICKLEEYMGTSFTFWREKYQYKEGSRI